MSLESQLHKKADAIFQKAYIALFTQFEAGLNALIGFRVEDQIKIQPSHIQAALKPLADVVSMRYTGNSLSAAATARDCAINLHREKFIADFIKKAEELAEFVDNGGAQ